MVHMADMALQMAGQTYGDTSGNLQHAECKADGSLKGRRFVWCKKKVACAQALITHRPELIHDRAAAISQLQANKVQLDFSLCKLTHIAKFISDHWQSPEAGGAETVTEDPQRMPLVNITNTYVASSSNNRRQDEVQEKGQQALLAAEAIGTDAMREDKTKAQSHNQYYNWKRVSLNRMVQGGEKFPNGEFMVAFLSPHGRNRLAVETRGILGNSDVFLQLLRDAIRNVISIATAMHDAGLLYEKPRPATDNEQPSAPNDKADRQPVPGFFRFYLEKFGEISELKACNGGKPVGVTVVVSVAQKRWMQLSPQQRAHFSPAPVGDGDDGGEE
jgi:hypothetical protein